MKVSETNRVIQNKSKTISQREIIKSFCYMEIIAEKIILKMEKKEKGFILLGLTCIV